ncbi:MAG: outer membrane lipid asymmetry maintenance protein MlaD [Holosporaceae bacterium]|jgi:phospholipid/cholesterol/gamma-HCH transport system substrate-binding protein|nr:outer membrane lipid asymmetry maintenance protein MlaD [Holosporaceae bacterium]
MEKGRSFETIVGVFVLVVAVFFANYVYRKSGITNADGYSLIAKFDRADGLSEGGDVRISGVKVGKIINLDIDPSSFQAIVKFRIPKGMKLPKDTGANVTSDGLFGGRYLALIPGGEEDCLKEGEEILSTTGPINMESLIGKFLFSKDNGK